MPRLEQAPPTEASPDASAPPRDIVGEATALCRKGNVDAAIAKYKELLQERPKSPDAYAGLIRVYLKQKKFDQAAQTAAGALALTDSPRVRVANAEVLFRQGKIDQAELEWAKAINAGFPEARAYLGLARVRNARAMYKSAEGMIKRAHELDPEDPEIEELWIATLPREERIKYLENALASNEWDSDKRQSTASYLQYLKEQANAKYPPCRLLSNVSTTEIPLVMMLGEDTFWSGWGLSVFLKGHKSSLLLDTGASGIVLGRKAAERAGITRLAGNRVGGIGDKGSKSGYIGIADFIQIGNLEFEGCPIQVMDDRSVIGGDGLVGSDFFQDFLVDLDFPSVRLKLSALPKRPGEPDPRTTLTDEAGGNDRRVDQSDAGAAEAKQTPSRPALALQDAYIAPEMQSFTRVLRFGHDLLIPTTVGTVSGKLFLLDTGAFNNAISPAAAREVTKVYGDANKSVKGIGGSVKKVFNANKVVLQFGRMRQENQDMVGFDTSAISDDDGTEVSGFLGFEMLKYLDIKIDYRDALVDFSYDPKRWKF
jgi:tetratricopeptide (TPR) repeat protein